MKFKDIVNRDIVNLQNCEQEPIHIPGSIQPHGCLMAVSAEHSVIEYCSGNANEYLGVSHDMLLGKTLGETLGAVIEKSILLRVTSAPSSAPLILHINHADLFCNIHQSEGSNNLYILEFEPVETKNEEYPDVYDQTRQFLSYMEHSITLQQLCQLVADRTRDITGYDRVMIYRFDEEYNGEVFAESLREDLEPFLGLHYPHTDIPVQARQLYMKNLLRIITDINYKPVPIYTIDDGKDKNLDLGLSVLRSTSPIHVQYLQNMGVGASLTLSLIHKQRLWGLIACHHYSAKNISPNVRIAAQLQAHFIVSQIDMRQATEEYELSIKTSEEVEAAQVATKAADSFEQLVDNKNLLSLCGANGVCICFQDELYIGGNSPDETTIRRLIKDLGISYLHKGFQTAHLSDTLSYMDAYTATAAGIIYHPLSPQNQDCIIWFRPETITQVEWGGDPNKAIVKDEKGLHPRKSFELWQEVVKGKSHPWQRPELNAATAYANALQKHISLMVMSANEQEYRELSEQLKDYNDELENINWISTHDLQEPLRKIQLMSSRILTYNDDQIPEKVLDMVHRMDRSANRMQTLLKDILNYTKVRYSNEDFVEVNLNEVVQQVEQDMEEKIKETRATIVAKDLPNIKGVRFLLVQLFANLIGNSIKFAHENKPLHIAVATLPQVLRDGVLYHYIVVSDTGIGFEEQYAESIFKIFSRLHNNSAYEGSGVGLALCKKILDTHEGYISASGELNKGAEFHLYFPV